jgi:drug/metabolite transporter (DMT)-like permease
MVRVLLTSRLWVSGFVVGIVAVGLMVIGYSLAPIAVVQTIFGAGLVFLVLASRVYLHEPIGRREYFGLCVIVAAVIVVSLTLRSATAPGVAGSTLDVVGVTAATVIAAGLIFLVLHRRSSDASLPFGATSGLLYGIAALQTKGASVLIEKHGLFEGIPRVLASPYPYLFVVMSILGLLIFQSGIQQCRMAVLGPITNSVASVYVVLVGMFVFGETFFSDAALSISRLCGFALVVVGSWIFATGPTTSSRRPVADDLAIAPQRSDSGGVPQPGSPADNS